MSLPEHRLNKSISTNYNEKFISKREALEDRYTIPELNDDGELIKR